MFDVVNDQGFAIHYRGISNMVSHLEVFHCERIKLYSKAKAWADFFILNVLEAIIFQLYGFLQGHKVSQNDGY